MTEKIEHSTPARKKKELAEAISKAIYENDNKEITVSLVTEAINSYLRFLNNDLTKNFGNLIEQEFDEKNNINKYT
ncbi:TPA: hypothetical protein ITS68_002678 [Enterococcus faecalis]|uniref:hypothetical protein n=1 Tax=Lactobacillales TaxID=186826 RepID=UPI0011448F8E|nr:MULTISPECIES: hypothetical protein [Lactobacillales]MCL4596064.1 hypothetical protein [Enterococcus faecalis]MDB1685322.1 hypothetical protein [Enterococcus durans]MDM7644486.1 hypothetical protein [Lactococcus lactis]NSW26215.1 hypothetical protein [Enterococcus faecalis]TQB60952.1 hypothetical protein FKZ15_14215 [Enterococcus faecalis]